MEPLCPLVLMYDIEAMTSETLFFVAQTWDAHCGKIENMLTKILSFFRYTTHDFQMLHQVLVKPIEK